MAINIRFVDVTGQLNEVYAPRPAKAEIPEWYKKMPSFATGLPNLDPSDKKFFEEQGGQHGPPTMKKCIPIFDSLTSGYILVTHSDFLVYSVDDDPHPWYRWSDTVDPKESLIDFHEYFQVVGYPMDKEFEGRQVGRYFNAWSSITPKGYSCLFVPPMHRESNISIIPAVVDTDIYSSPVQLPFFLNDPNWRGLVPAGTPIAQVIPFKRDSFTHTIEKDDPNDSLFKKNGRLIRSKFYNVYKQHMWSKKQYN